MPSRQFSLTVTVNEMLGDRDRTGKWLGNVTPQMANVGSVPQDIEAKEGVDVWQLSSLTDFLM